MYVTNKDLEILRKMQGIVWYLELNEEEKKVYSDFVDLIDKLEAIKKIKNIKNTKRVAEKRKIDPSYASRKKEEVK